ncbi:hypothetical protein [Cypionkella sp.]|jgi:hypothetical protein|uniref:hypothetical protein n=1 Tax=Cypionkella sp. TaxID=2811411 RepID=UPI00272419A3|nr:hypothetical protein [Cypionkella sp.]MDO8986482.1 hypothetical protein [Cypionkella sp.]MDP2051868.1 hypothetical protein [Cypionkella sp.]
MLVPFVLVAAIFAFQCHSRLSKWMFLGLALMLLAVEVAGACWMLIQLPGCSGNVLNGIYCPPTVQASRSYRIAQFAAWVWVNGMMKAVVIGIPLGILAVFIEFRSRLVRQ